MKKLITAIVAVVALALPATAMADSYAHTTVGSASVSVLGGSTSVSFTNNNLDSPIDVTGVSVPAPYSASLGNCGFLSGSTAGANVCELQVSRPNQPYAGSVPSIPVTVTYDYLGVPADPNVIQEGNVAQTWPAVGVIGSSIPSSFTPFVSSGHQKVTYQATFNEPVVAWFNVFNKLGKLTKEFPAVSVAAGDTLAQVWGGNNLKGQHATVGNTFTVRVHVASAHGVPVNEGFTLGTTKLLKP